MTNDLNLDRRSQMLQLKAQGVTYREIAERYQISVARVDQIINNVRKPKGAQKPTFIYVVECASDSHRFIKIGIAMSVERRFRSLQSGCPLLLTLIGFIRGSRAIEQEAHSRLEKSRLWNEWYQVTPEVEVFLSQFKELSIEGGKEK